jgi:twitching motility protein PilT
VNLESLIAHAHNRGASDLHLEPGLPAAMRIRGELGSIGEALSAGLVRGLVRKAVGEPDWPSFSERKSWDGARTIASVRCRLNAMSTQRGVGLAIRLLPGRVPSLASLNLHPDLGQLINHPHGLILVSGPTGSGKSSTQASLLQAINEKRSCHVLTLEQPIEFQLKPDRAFIRQREVGRDTPSFEQALIDALRQDPDVLMVGELREPEVMRLTLAAAETGHLVLATLHSATVAEAIQRMVLAFPAQIQASIASQLADCLRAVLCQRLVSRPGLDFRLPECELLRASSGARGAIRQSEFHKLTTIMETGGNDGMWSQERYRAWLSEQSDFTRPGQDFVPLESEDERTTIVGLPRVETQKTTPAQSDLSQTEVMVIDTPGRDAKDILSEMEGKQGKK